MESSGPSNSMRSNLGILEGQSGQMPSDEAFSSLLPPHTQYNNANLLGDGHGEMDTEIELLTHHSDNQMLTDQQSLSHLQQMQQFSPALISQPPQQQQIHLEESMFLYQQQQQQKQQRYLHWKRYFSADAAAAQLNQMPHQRLLDMQQYQNSQQHQLLRAFSQQRSQMQQQLQSRNLPMRSPIRSVSIEKFERRIAQYIVYQKHRPQDNNIKFWREFVSTFFTPNAKKVWCVSMYGKLPLTTGAFPQNTWHCAICKRKPGRGFEASFDYLPRLFKIKYESGIVEELLYVDMPHGCQDSSGHIILTYSTAVQQSVYEQLRIVRYGRLRIVFSPDLKIRCLEFCAVKHEEVIPRRRLTSQVRHLGNVAQNYQACIQNNAASNLCASDLQSSSTMFRESARGIAKTLQGPLLNELAYPKRYVQCLQIAEVVDRMKDVIDFSLGTGTSPLESLAILWGRTNNTSSGQNQDSKEGQRQQQQRAQTSNGVATVNNTHQSQDPGNQNWPENGLQNVWKPAS